MNNTKIIILTVLWLPSIAFAAIDFKDPRIDQCDAKIKQVYRSYATSLQSDAVPLLNKIVQGFTAEEKKKIFSQEYRTLKKEIETSSVEKSEQYDKFTKQSYYKMGTKMMKVNQLKSALEMDLGSDAVTKKQKIQAEIAKLESEILGIRKSLDATEARVFKEDARKDPKKKIAFQKKQNEIQTILDRRVQAMQNEIPKDDKGKPKYQVVSRDGQIRISQKPGDTMIDWDFLKGENYSVHVNIDRLPENLTAEYKRECSELPTKLSARERYRFAIPASIAATTNTQESVDRGDNTRGQ